MHADAAGSERTHAARSLLATKHLNQGTLTSVLKALQDAPDLATLGFEEGAAALAGVFESVRRTEPVTLDDGSTFHWDFCDPNLLLARTLHESAFLAESYAHALAQHPCSEQQPWSLVVLFDEFTPGSISHPQLDRATMTLAFNFLELGPAALSLDATWLIPVLVRRRRIRDAQGGWSACLAMYLRAQLLGGLSIQRVGVSFTLGGSTFTVWARLRCLCSDGEGLQHALDILGPNGIRPCIRCQNVLKKGSGLAHRRANFVEVTCADHTRFIKSTPENLDAEVASVLDAWRQVHAGTRSQASAQLLETATGIHANPTGLLADASLRACFSVLEVLNEDWMHGALQDGVLFIIINLLLRSVCEKLEWTLDRVEQFLKADWCFPKAVRGKMRGLWRMFDAHARERMDEKMRFKYTASELLGLYVLLRHFVLAIVVPAAASRGVDLGPEIAVFLAYCRVIDTIMMLKKGFANDADAELLIVQLEAHLDRAMALQMRVFGAEGFRPKHHRMQHIAGQIREFRFVLDAFIIERLHLVVREVLAKVHNPATFEQSLLKFAMARQIAALNAHAATHGLTGRTAPLRGFPAARAAAAMLYCGMALASGDVVFRDSVAGEVTLCATEGGRGFVIVEVWREVAVVTAHSRKWQKTGSQEAWPVEDLEQSAAWYKDGDDVVVLS